MAAAVAALLAAVFETPAPAGAETLDRVVAAVGTRAITASEVEREYRLERVLDGKAPASAPPGEATLDQVRERLIDRVLLEHDVEVTGVKVSPDSGAVQQRLDEIRKKFSNPAAFRSALSDLGLSEGDLRQILANQEEILRLIDQRWRPLASVDSSEIEKYYHDVLLPELARQGSQQPPPLADVESRIREILVQQKIDGLLDNWLKRVRGERDVRVFGAAGLEAGS